MITLENRRAQLDAAARTAAARQRTARAPREGQLDTDTLIYRGHLASANELMARIEAEDRPATSAERAEIDRKIGEAFALAKAAERCHLIDIAWHEAAHAVAFTAEGIEVETVYVKFNEARPGFAGGATSAPAGSPPPSAVAFIAGQVAARYYAERGPTHYSRNDSDDKQILEAIGKRPDLRERAKRRAHELLAIHERTARVIAQRLMATGAIGGEELKALLAPVVAWRECQAA